MKKSNLALKRMSTRPSRNQQSQRNRRRSMLDMNKCSSRSSREAKKQRLRKNKSNWKQAAYNWKRAGYNSKRAGNSLKPPEEVRRRTPVEVRALRQLLSHRRSNTNMTSISTMSTNRNKLSVSAAIGRALLSTCVAGFLSTCATEPPPLPANNPADPQVRSGLRTPRNLLTQDETTVAIERELRPTQAYAESAEKMEHDMQKMPGKQHEGMQHGGMQ